jgi:Ca-activated chloride channel family protein
MRIFPIGPRAEQRVELTYYQELDCDHDWATYVYPLATATRREIAARTTGRFSLEIEVKSAVPIAEIESPSHAQAFALARHEEGYWQANLEATGGDLSRDVVLACHLVRPKTGMDLLTSKREGADGFFCLTLMAGEDVAKSSAGMDYVFVLDVSGSMADEGKLALSKGSVSAFLGELGEGDRFEVMTFNVQPALAFGELRPADVAAREAATAYLASQQARGGTVLRSALSTAYKYGTGARPLNVVILSDGLTEQQERQVLLEMIRQRPVNTRVFCVGVGNDVNRALLEQLAGDAGGLAAFVSREDNFARQARLFREKLLRPVATDVQISIQGVEVSNLEPKVLPNLYHGAPVRVYGRYHGGGKATVTLQANLEGKPLEQSSAMTFPAVDLENPEIDRLWATHRIDHLLKEADRAGSRSPVLDEIIRLGEEFSVVTEYTSFLVLENDAEYQRWKIARKNLETFGRDQQAFARRREHLDGIRDKALADLGPQPATPAVKAAPQRLASAPATTPAPLPNAAATPSAQPQGRQSWDLNVGTSPVGPLGLVAVLWLLRRKQQAS